MNNNKVPFAQDAVPRPKALRKAFLDWFAVCGTSNSTKNEEQDAFYAGYFAGSSAAITVVPVVAQDARAEAAIEREALQSAADIADNWGTQTPECCDIADAIRALIPTEVSAPDIFAEMNLPSVAAPSVAVAQDAQAMLPFAILDGEMAALRRFHECALDGEGYDVADQLMQRLAEIGLLHRSKPSKTYFEETVFGLSILNGDFAAPSLPAVAPQVHTMTLTGHQILAALEFIAPTGPGGQRDPGELDDDLTFGVAPHQDDDGNSSTGMCCWNEDTEGVLPLDGEPAEVPAVAPQEQLRAAWEDFTGESEINLDRAFDFSAGFTRGLGAAPQQPEAEPTGVELRNKSYHDLTPDERIKLMTYERAQLVASEYSEDNIWHEEIVQQCMKVESCYVKDNPHKTIENLISYHVALATEEMVSVWDIVSIRDTCNGILKSGRDDNI